MHLLAAANLWVAYQTTMTDKIGLLSSSPSTGAEQSPTKEPSDGSNCGSSSKVSSSGLGDKTWGSDQDVQQSTTT
jgi:hypothetical protein